MSNPSDQASSPPSPFRSALIMVCLIIAGEAIFLLPFVLVRIFRPTFLDVLGVNNLQLGLAFSTYGVVAMIAYFFGGPLADRFSARRLMSIALVATSLGGVIFAAAPSLTTLIWLYGFWGLTTILLFWAALIRATREWGGVNRQGRAYGFLDGGRGLFAAIISSIAVVIFASLLPVDVSTASLEQRGAALGTIIWLFTGMIAGIALLVWLVVPESKLALPKKQHQIISFAGVRKVFKLPEIWLQAIIVICAYVGYKGTDDFSLYARDAFGYDDVAAAQIATITFWIRPFAAVGAGYIGDRIRSSNMIIISFAIVMLGSLIIASGSLAGVTYGILLTTIAGTSVGIYALRGIYFALFQEAKIPLVYTGSAVGLVSVIGYTPDIFMGPLLGYLIDRSPGALGHQHVFGVLAGFALVGLLATVVFQQVIKQR